MKLKSDKIMRPNFSELKYSGAAACSKVENNEWVTPEKIVVKGKQICPNNCKGISE